MTLFLDAVSPLPSSHVIHLVFFLNSATKIFHSGDTWEWEGPGWHHPGGGIIRCKRQRSKGARSFRGQKILKPGHQVHFLSSKRSPAFPSDATAASGLCMCWTCIIGAVFKAWNITDARQLLVPSTDAYLRAQHLDYVFAVKACYVECLLCYVCTDDYVNGWHARKLNNEATQETCSSLSSNHWSITRELMRRSRCIIELISENKLQCIYCLCSCLRTEVL